MSKVEIRSLGQVMVDTSTDVGRADAGQGNVRRSEAQLQVRELDILRADLDLLASPESLELGEKLVSDYLGNATSGDQLRLPQLTNLDGRALRSAVSRLLATDSSSGGASQIELAKENRMRSLLRDLANTVADIQRQATMTVRY
ncbi:MAG: hypothetical protein IPG45_30685 [Deltaproteobacteria bacterium]|jgi:hypothetical protein|nr:hypothetical protein [Deltaproteobacteria bacterium]